MINLHPSGIASFFDCSYRWYRDNLHNPIRRVGIAAFLGTGLHKAAEMYYKESINDKNWAKVKDDYKGLAIDTFRERVKIEDPLDIHEVDLNNIEKDMGSSCLSYLNKCKELNNNKLPQAIEKTYEVKLNSFLIDKITGTLDIVGDDYICDIKTMSRLKNPKSYLMQQGIYGYLRKEANENVEDLLIHRIVLFKNQIDCVSIKDSLENVFTPIDAIINKAKSYVDVVVDTVNEFNKTGNEILFRGNPESMLCSKKYCAYYNECKYKKEV